MIRLSGGVGLLLTLLAVLAAACSGGSSDSSTPTPAAAAVCVATGVTPTGLVAPLGPETQLEVILLQDDEVPALQRSSLIFSTNEDLAESAPDPDAELARLGEIGRILGAQADFIPTDAASSTSIARGVQSSASLYTAADGASQSLQESVEETRLTDWDALYPELSSVRVEELTRTIGDESAWFRVRGSDPAGMPVVDDQVVFRAGRARAFVRVFGQFPDEDAIEGFADEVEACAEIVVKRARDILAANPEDGTGSMRSSEVL